MIVVLSLLILDCQISYANDLSGIKKWVRTPGRKRMGYPAMTGFPQLTDIELSDLGHYVFVQ